jgi:hypothetical protein
MKDRHKQPAVNIAPIEKNGQQHGPCHFNYKCKNYYAAHDSPGTVFNVIKKETFYRVRSGKPKTHTRYDDGKTAKTYYTKPADLYQTEQRQLAGKAEPRCLYRCKARHADRRGRGKNGVRKTEIPRPRAAEFQYQGPSQNNGKKKYKQAERVETSK